MYGLPKKINKDAYECVVCEKSHTDWEIDDEWHQKNMTCNICKTVYWDKMKDETYISEEECRFRHINRNLEDEKGLI